MFHAFLFSFILFTFFYLTPLLTTKILKLLVLFEYLFESKNCRERGTGKKRDLPSAIHATEVHDSRG